MSIIKHVTLQKIVAHDFRYDLRIIPLSALPTTITKQLGYLLSPRAVREQVKGTCNLTWGINQCSSHYKVICVRGGKRRKTVKSPLNPTNLEPESSSTQVQLQNMRLNGSFMMHALVQSFYY